MLREEVPDAQRKESQRLWMEGEQGEDQNTGSGRDQVGPGGRVFALRGCIHGELGDWQPLGHEHEFGATVHRVRTRAFPLSASLWKAALLPCFLQADSPPGCKSAFSLLLPSTTYSLIRADLALGHGMPGLRFSSGPELI